MCRACSPTCKSKCSHDNSRCRSLYIALVSRGSCLLGPRTMRALSGSRTRAARRPHRFTYCTHTGEVELRTRLIRGWLLAVCAHPPFTCAPPQSTTTSYSSHARTAPVACTPARIASPFAGRAAAQLAILYIEHTRRSLFRPTTFPNPPRPNDGARSPHKRQPAL